VESLTDFIKNAGLFTLLHLFMTGIFILAAIVLFFSASTRSAMWAWRGIGIVPAVSGILLWYLRNRSLNTAIGLMSDLIPEDVSGIRREARINLLVGLAGTIVISVLQLWRQRLNREIKA
jgi:hypothetical protein